MLLNYFGKTTPFTEGASKEQMLLELELVSVKKQSMLFAYIEFCLAFFIVTAPLAVIVYFAKGRKLKKRVAELTRQIEEIQIKNASK